MAWEAIEQMTSRWGLQANDVFKSKEWLLSTLIDVVAKGGNFMPGVSPLPSGKFPPQIVERLEYAGDWLRVSGEAIYNTRGWNAYEEGDDIRFTRSKDGAHVYALSMKWPGASFRLQSVRARKGSAITLLGTKAKLKWRQDKDGLVIDIPESIARHKPCTQAYVFQIEAQPFRGKYE